VSSYGEQVVGQVRNEPDDSNQFAKLQELDGEFNRRDTYDLTQGGSAHYEWYSGEAGAAARKRGGMRLKQLTSFEFKRGKGFTDESVLEFRLLALKTIDEILARGGMGTSTAEVWAPPDPATHWQCARVRPAAGDLQAAIEQLRSDSDLDIMISSERARESAGTVR
jgi:hypothetical protein